MIELIVISIGLLLGYFMHILTKLMSNKEPDISKLDDYIKKENVQVIFHLCALYVIGTLWLKTNLLQIIPKSMWVSPIVGIATPRIWDALMEWIDKLIDKIKH